MKENLIADKSKHFAVRIVRLRRYLADNYKEWVLSDQICRSGTSIGALKEADETAYWLEILHDTDYINTPLYNSLNSDCDEIIRILTAILKTKKENQIK